MSKQGKLYIAPLFPLGYLLQDSAHMGLTNIQFSIRNTQTSIQLVLTLLTLQFISQSRAGSSTW